MDAGTVLYAKWKDPEGNIVELPKGEKPEMERVVVTGSTVNVRSGPGTFYDKVDTVSEGTILTLTEVYEGNGYVWGKFSKGWLSLSYTNYKDAPVITKQPKSTNVTKGSKAKVSVEATGKDLTYQWYYKDAGAGEFKKSSANTASYSLTMNESRTGRKVYCMITDGYGNTVKTKTVTLGMAVSIAKQPKKASAAEGEKAKVRVTATGDGLTYRWYYKDAGSSKFKESGANTATYSLTMNESRAGRQVYCKITDEYGNTVKSKTVTLGMAVSITKQPKNASADEGKKVKLSVSATGDGLTYQWYYKSKNSSKFKKSSGTGKATYSITMNEGRNDRQMYCVITDAYGNSVKTKTVTIGLNARITKQPKSAQAQDGEKVKVSVSATGVGLSYRWYYKDAGAGKFKKSGANTATYSLTMNESCAGRQVYCVITDLYGNSVKTKTVTLGMAVSISKQPKSVQVAKGKTAKVTVSATGDGLTYKWYVKNQGESKYTRDKSVKGKTYSVKMSSKVSGRLVYCKITDAYGNTVKAKTVTLKMK